MNSWFYIVILIIMVLFVSMSISLRKANAEKQSHDLSMAAVMLASLYISTLVYLLQSSLLLSVLAGLITAALISVLVGFRDDLQWPAIVHGLMASLMAVMIVPMLGVEETAQFMDVLSLITFLWVLGWIFYTQPKRSPYYKRLFLYAFLVTLFYQFLTYITWPM
ncbi:hypothetical protein [Thalassobacillus pellis]|uniref:hypothetical protein n=1 Tax=Thalassobacillus pellis TaxID=748008 RepID=UPI00196086D4|nr:hypothetical protein [Thalassobacillus pellis]MBM7553002.1 Flp pilus assembly pilin Flp [Thalassobacillus pellis]